MKNDYIEGVFEGLKFAIKILGQVNSIEKAKEILQSHLKFLTDSQKGA